jgi:hypothetical protein
MTYLISVEEGGGVTTLRGADEGMSPEFGRLLEWLERHFES